MTLKAPFPWFGGKSRVADLVWSRFGDVPNYVEPFFGSGAVLLGRPHEAKIETVNDKDAMLANFWRAVKHAPESVAEWADNPVNEADLHARHLWLVAQLDGGFPEYVMGDPEFFDAKIAGWWVWGICCWIGSGWCSGNGPWHSVDGKMVRTGDAGRGVNRQLVHVGNAGRGVNRQLGGLVEWMQALSDRLDRVRVCCGDWSRVMGPTVTEKNGLTGVFLDPPYADTAGRDPNIYSHDSQSVAHDLREWAIANGDNPKLRIALCGYEGEHEMPDSWECVAWKAKGGYGGQSNGHDNPNARRERIWFSPHCLKPTLTLFDMAGSAP